MRPWHEPGTSFALPATRASPPIVRFATDSLLERGGFELPVPLAKQNRILRRKGRCCSSEEGCLESVDYPAGGDEGSNPCAPPTIRFPRGAWLEADDADRLRPAWSDTYLMTKKL